jgi:putative tryptophan/tyrosine transport system substrate-binding protein
MMRRREFIALLGSAVAWPLAARAQQPPAVPVIGLLGGTAFVAGQVAAFRLGLAQTGYVEGQNVTIEYRSAEGQYDRLPALAADLVNRKVSVIATTGGLATALAAKAATSTIPIVFGSGGDVVKSGLVTSLNRPGGLFTQVVEAKKLDLLVKLVPTATVGFLLNPAYPGSEWKTDEMQEAGRNLSRQVAVLKASTEGEIDAAFATLVQRPIDAVIIGADPFFNNATRANRRA